jgi:heme-degrading monooxygenase HmoA
MIAIVWAFQVKADRIAEFERIYAPAGQWAKLFKKGKGFLETRLIQSPDHAQRFVTIDQWETIQDSKTFLALWKEEYETLDRQCEGLTESESRLGIFGDGFNDEE